MSILRGHLRVYIRVQRSKCLNLNCILSIREIKVKTDIISLSQEFFDGADVDIEVRAKVIYESDTEDIINQYIIFCKVFDEQRKLYGMTAQTVRETIRICKNRNILKECLMSRDVEIVTIMMSLFDDEQIMKTHWKDMKNTLTDKITHDKDKKQTKG